MFNLFKSAEKNRRADKALEIKTSLAERWDLNAAFTLPGAGPANFLVDALSQVFHRLNTFIAQLTKRNVVMAMVAPQALAISRQVRQSSESLSQRAEQIEQTCCRLAEGISRSSDSATRALDQSASIVSEISQTGSLTDQALQRMQAMERNVGQLSSSIAVLDQKSRSIASIIESISDIADNTGLLSLNAFIEAAQEVKDSLLGISELIQETVTAVAQVREGVDAGMRVNQEASAALSKVSREHHRFHLHLESVISGVSDQKKAVEHFADDLAKITTIGKEGKDDSAKLAELAEKVKTLTEEQLLSTGIFILPQYRKAEAQVVAMATDPDICTTGKATDQTLQRRMQPLPYLELVYLTDTEGLQVSSNVFRKDQAMVCDVTAKGKDWSRKTWFTKVKETGKPFISEIYKSEATDSFCLTISVPVYRQSAWVGVLGADISFEDLLNI